MCATEVNVLDNVYLIICLTLLIVSYCIACVSGHCFFVCFLIIISNPLISCKKKLIRKCQQIAVSTQQGCRCSCHVCVRVHIDARLK